MYGDLPLVCACMKSIASSYNCIDMSNNIESMVARHTVFPRIEASSE